MKIWRRSLFVLLPSALCFLLLGLSAWPGVLFMVALSFLLPPADQLEQYL